MIDSRFAVLGVKVLTSLLQTDCSSLWPNNWSLYLCPCDRQETSFKVLCLERGLLSWKAASQFMSMQNTLDCGHWQLSSSSFSFIADLLFGSFWRLLPDRGRDFILINSCLHSWSWDLWLLWDGSKWLSRLVQINNELFQINAELVKTSSL